jgi:alanine dehydrogenase
MAKMNDKSRCYSFITKEQLKTVAVKKESCVIGIPRENQDIEKRVAITPETVATLVDLGYKVVVESGAGIPINYTDNYYSENGAEIVESPGEVFRSDIILKILPPTLNEVEMMQKNAIVFSFMYVGRFSKHLLEAMMAKHIRGVAYELMWDDTGVSPFVTSISEIEGLTSITLAAEMLSNAHGGKGIMLGGIPGVTPTEVVIFGAGVAGTMAAKAAIALGAEVKVFDDDLVKLRTIRRDLGISVFTSTLQRNVMNNVFRSADVVIGAMRYINNRFRYRVPSDLIMGMKKGSIIIDLRMAQGGCFETTMESCLSGAPAIFEKFGVLHFCEMSLSCRVARTASIAVSNVFVSLFNAIQHGGGIDHFAKFDQGFASGYYTYSGKMVNRFLADYFGLPISDINLYIQQSS